MNFNGLPAMEAAQGERGSAINASDFPYDQWVSLPPSGLKPSARYKHAAAVAGEKLFVTGGSRNGRYLSDIHVLDFKTLTWSVVAPNPQPGSEKPLISNQLQVLPACAGHSMVKWGNQLLIVAGHLKESSDTVTVRFFDVETHCCHAVATSGKAPVARGGQSIALVGSRLIMFGGEDVNRRLLNDLHILDLETLTWEEVETMQTSPAPRFDHTAAVLADRYLLIFGGGSHSNCFNDLHVLDLQTMEWSQPQIQGEAVTARAGHAGAKVYESWYIVGGGDNSSGVSETITLNMSKLVWSVVTNVKERDPLASEGLSVCSTTVDGEKLLVAFGGYNGKYNNEVFVLKPKPRDSSRPKIFQSPAAAAAAASVKAAYALTSTTGNKLDHPSIEEAPPEEVKNEISPTKAEANADVIREENKQLESALKEAISENSRLKEAIDSMNNNHAELSKELHSVQGQLEAEKSRCFKLEVQIAELRRNLESLPSIERELQVLQQQRSALEREMELASDGGQQNTSGGVWRWIVG